MKRTAEAKINKSVYAYGPTLAARMPVRLHVRSDLHLARKAWHMIMGLVMVAVYVVSGMSKMTGVLILGSILGIDLMVETLRLKVPSFNEKVLRQWGAIMRSHEVNSFSTVPYYLSAAILAIAIFPKPIAVLSILYLACGDPIASLFGILYGDRSIRLANGKSLIGTGAGIFMCAIISFLFLSAQGLPSSTVLILTAVGGAAGGAAELLPLDVDDNFSIPVVSGFVLWLAFILLGI